NLITGATPFGSIEGAGSVFVGDFILTVGTNNLSTTFSGDLQGKAGRLIKVGTGTLTLTGSSSTYRGSTTVNGGTLLVNGNLT
ncbi:autotransporter-associated beta strand repeat-containing protein, partial [Acinetobacter baumannii]|uniref:autotransporter-associated beta strand repeat-containing protein n=1 Tax=Acinetobacter baumannii TaxID=470 RepID=UPI0013D4C1BF